MSAGAGEAPPGDRDGRRRRRRTPDPTGKDALFTSPPVAAGDQLTTGPTEEGRAAFYSTGPHRPGTAVVTCETCGVRSRSSLVGVGRRMTPFTFWLPTRHHPHWMHCTTCGRHTWCRIDWSG